MKTVKEIRENKQSLEKEIKNLIEKFENENEVEIRDIHYWESAKTIGSNRGIYNLTLDIKI